MENYGIVPQLQLSTIIPIYIILINIIGFFIMLIDKKKAENGKWRIQEKTIFMVTILGGGIGTILGMYIFRHKTRVDYFTVGVPLIMIMQAVVIFYLMNL